MSERISYRPKDLHPDDAEKLAYAEKPFQDQIVKKGGIEEQQRKMDENNEDSILMKGTSPTTPEQAQEYLERKAAGASQEELRKIQDADNAALAEARKKIIENRLQGNSAQENPESN